MCWRVKLWPRVLREEAVRTLRVVEEGNVGTRGFAGYVADITQLVKFNGHSNGQTSGESNWLSVYQTPAVRLAD